MCKWGTMVVMEINGKPRDIDSCIAPIVRALNDAGIPTIACCCGHGKSNGNIALVDGRELIIVPDYQAARLAEDVLKNTKTGV